MHAALLLATLIFGAPVLPHGAAGDPAGEDQDADSGILAIADGLLHLGEQLIESEDPGEYLRILDLAILEFDITPVFEILGDLAVRRALDHTPDRAEAVRALVDVADPAWRAELRDGLEEALQLLPSAVDHPGLLAGRSALTEQPRELSQLLGDPDRPASMRLALLAYLRGFFGTAVLAVAADRGTQLSPWLSAAVIPAWRLCLHQLRRLLDAQTFAPVDRSEAALSPLANVLSGYQCRDGRLLSPYFRRDPGLADFLCATHDQLSRFFPDATTERIWLTPAHDPDDGEEHPGLEITVFTRQDPDAARTALAAFDAAWWLDHCNPPTRIVIDTHLV